MSFCFGFRPMLGFPILVMILAANNAGFLSVCSAKESGPSQVLDAWQVENTKPAERVLHVVAWTPLDREYPADYEARISRILLHVQAFYAKEMKRNGFGEITFPLAMNGPDRVVIHTAHGERPERQYREDPGSEVRADCLTALKKAGIDGDRETFIIFCNLAKYDEKSHSFSHHSPYYANGDYRSGTAWVLDSPELDIQNLAKPEPIVSDRQYGRISLGKHNSYFIGGVAHELGHAFGLPHTTERGDEKPLGTALMGNGNRTYGDELRGESRGSFLTFAHALRLASHPAFCRKMEVVQNQANAEASELAIAESQGRITISGILKGTPPIYGVVAYFDEEGNSDYNATSIAAVVGQDGKFSLTSDKLPTHRKGILHLCPLNANGELSDAATNRLRFSYEVSKDGAVDIETAQLRLTLAPVIELIAARNAKAAEALVAELRNEKAKIIAERLLDRELPNQSPSDFSGHPASVSLSRLKPISAQVGWLRPTYDHLPNASLLMEAGGRVFESGIYAHAPARHEYDLGEQWERLSGTVGLANGNEGSVVFTLEGDSRELWKSSKIEGGKLAVFNVDVRGVKKLALTVSPTDDGNRSDWGLWLEPTLIREAVKKNDSPQSRAGSE